jgi:acyl carrier protein
MTFTWERFAEGIATMHGIDLTTVTRATYLVGDLGLDSLALTELVVMLIEDFGMDSLSLELDGRQWTDATVGDLYDELLTGVPGVMVTESTQSKHG